MNPPLSQLADLLIGIAVRELRSGGRAESFHSPESTKPAVAAGFFVPDRAQKQEPIDDANDSTVHPLR